MRKTKLNIGLQVIAWVLIPVEIMTCIPVAVQASVMESFSGFHPCFKTTSKKAGEINIYAYVNNNPINGIDPLGLESEWEKSEKKRKKRCDELSDMMKKLKLTMDWIARRMAEVKTPELPAGKAELKQWEAELDKIDDLRRSAMDESSKLKCDPPSSGPGWDDNSSVLIFTLPFSLAIINEVKSVLTNPALKNFIIEAAPPAAATSSFDAAAMFLNLVAPTNLFHLKHGPQQDL